jgi:hypothetical protein
MHKVATSLEQGDVPFAPSCQTLVDDASSILLTVEDDTGTVEVDLRGATVIAKQKSRISSGLGGGIPVKLADLLRKEYGIHVTTPPAKAGGFLGQRPLVLRLSSLARLRDWNYPLALVLASLGSA